MPVGKDPKGRIWFKSDQYLKDITDATEFFVESSSYLGLWGRVWYLMGTFPNKAKYYSDDPKFVDEVLGEYKTANAASFALELIMTLRDIKEIDLFPIKDNP